MKEEKKNLRRKIYKLIAEHAKKLDNLQNVYEAVLDSLGGELSREEAEARVRAALGTFEKGPIPEEVDFPFISIIEKACKYDSEECRCKDACEGGAIIQRGKNKPVIDLEKCLTCGLCVVACPEGAVMDKTEIAQTINLIKKSKRVYAVLAPAFAGQFGNNVSEEKVKTALLMLGFYDVIEVALGADMITVKEAKEFIKRMNRKDDFMITSCCCPPFVRLAKGYHGKIEGLVSDSVSPMIAIGRFIKAEDESAKVVFIGPCIAKKSEAKLPELKDAVDCVLTFEELSAIFEGYKINLEDIKVVTPINEASSSGRKYAFTGGVTEAIFKSVRALEEKINFKAVHGNGLKECKEILEKLKDGKIDANFIEGMACVGGCVGGPGTIVDKEEAKKRVLEFAQKGEMDEAINNRAANILYEKHKDKVKLESHVM
ncbi:[Fe-Fe] hydrogenase large subunit C-terminal domain-containing protein [Thermovenabulum sp.]|uniref:[Fe-Fe] hydrogenase large subunit C-terminal domain-containing protein n=1 Tax=Thermovenabulum sp. TaxID=3100335 RepID=UPI003C7AB739